MTRYRKKPVVVDAMLWAGGDYECLNEFCGKNWTRADAVDEQGPDDSESVVVWNTKERQWLNLPVGHWVIRGVAGELYPCDPEIFALTYEQAAGGHQLDTPERPPELERPEEIKR